MNIYMYGLGNLKGYVHVGANHLSTPGLAAVHQMGSALQQHHGMAPLYVACMSFSYYVPPSSASEVPASPQLTLPSWTPYQWT